MKDKIMKFMEGRYGVDSFARFTLGVAFAAIILSVFCRNGSTLGTLLDTAGLLALIYTYYRMLSRDISRRSAENIKYQEKMAGLKQRLGKEKNIMQQRKTYHIYNCPNCRQKIRIPRGKGKIEIDCPKCHTKFIKKS